MTIRGIGLCAMSLWVQRHLGTRSLINFLSTKSFLQAIHRRTARRVTPSPSFEPATRVRSALQHEAIVRLDLGVIVGSRPMQKYQGSCHCGAVRFEIETDFPELTMCDCSICLRKNALMVKVHESQFRLLAGEESLTEYQFHTKTARHYFCKVCGIYPFHRKRVTPDNFGINVHCLEGFSPEGIPLRQAVGASMS